MCVCVCVCMFVCPHVWECVYGGVGKSGSDSAILLSICSYVSQYVIEYWKTSLD